MKEGSASFSANHWMAAWLEGGAKRGASGFLVLTEGLRTTRRFLFVRVTVSTCFRTGEAEDFWGSEDTVTFLVGDFLDEGVAFPPRNGF